MPNNKGMSQATPEPEVGLTVAAVASRLGIAPATLRTWDRRYGVGPSNHSEGQHRRYTAQDLELLIEMKAAILQGYSPADAARVARAALEADTSRVDAADAPQGKLSLVTDSDESGVVIDLSGPRASVRALTRAATMLDSHACDEIIRKLLAEKGVVWTWQSVLRPVLTSVGETWERTNSGIEVEHVLSEAIINQLRVITAALDDPTNSKPVLLAGAPNELHTLPLYVIAAGLAELKIESRMFGARLPLEALSAAFDRIGPCAVVVWSHTRGTADAAIWQGLTQLRHMPLLLAGGHGWLEEELPEEIERASDLQATLLSLVVASGR